MARNVAFDRSFYGHDQLLTLELASGRRVRSRGAGITNWNRGDDVEIVVDGPVHVLAHDVE